MPAGRRNLKPIKLGGGLIPLNPLLASPGPILYVDSRLPTSLPIVADGTPVALWTDLSGRGNHLSQVAGWPNAQPTYLTSNPSPNGQPLVRFTAAGACTGQDSRLDCLINDFSIVGGWPALTNGYTLYFWLRRRNFLNCAGTRTHLFGGGTGRPRALLSFDSLGPAQDVVSSDTSAGTVAHNTIVSTGAVNPAGLHTLTWQFQPPDGLGNPEIRVDGIAIPTFNDFWVAPMNPALSAGFFLGSADTVTPALASGGGCECDIGAVIMFTQLHSSLTMRRIELFLRIAFGGP